MIERSFLTGGMLAAAAALMMSGAARAEEAGQPAPVEQPSSVILNLINRAGRAEARDKAFTESIKRDALAPRSSALDAWELQPDGSMRHKRTGVNLIVRNPCPPGDIEHEFALAAYKRAMAGKSRR